MQMDKPKIIVKTKNLQIVFDYCIETKTEFTVIPKSSNEDWEIELNIRNIKEAVKWGMFLKANKLDLIDNAFLANSATVSKSSTVTHKSKKERQTKIQTDLTNINNNTSELEEKNSELPESILDFSQQKNLNELF